MVVTKIKHIKAILELEQERKELWEDIFYLDDTVAELKEKNHWLRNINMIMSAIIIFQVVANYFF